MKKKIISKSKIFNTGVEFKNEVFDSEIEEINPLSTNEQYVSFHNCVFEKKVCFKNIVANRISFINCEFYKEITLEDVEVETIIFGGCKLIEKVVLLNSSVNKLSIDECKFEDSLFINGEYNELLVHSIEVDLIKILDINSNSNLKNSSIEFFGKNEIKNVKFECESVFSKIIFKQSGEYENISFEGEFNNQILFEGKINCKNLFFSSALINNRIDIKKGSYEYLSFSRSVFNGLIWINEIDRILNRLDENDREIKIDRMSIHSNLFRKNVSLGDIEIKSLDISNNSFEKLFSFNTYKRNDLNLNKVWLSFDGVNQGSVHIEGIDCDLSLGGMNFGSVVFRNSIFSELHINSFQNKGSVSFFNISSGARFTIQDSTTGNLEFLNSDINLFNEIVIANSNIENIRFNQYLKNIRSYSSNPKVGYGIEDKSKNRSNLRSVYSQLKQIAKREGNIDSLTKYKSLEFRQLLFDKKMSFDKVLLILNWISNDNGRSWFKGILFTLTTALIFYALYLSAIGTEINFSLKTFWTNYILFTSSFPKLSLEKYSQYNSIWNVSLVIWLSRIFISYGIYQTIAAFRKFGKS